MKITPFGEVKKDRLELSKKYKLIEMVTNGFWRLTKKCRDNYDSQSYILYLRGELEQPSKKTNPKQNAVSELLSL